jgi:hypothetical protein
MREGRPQKRRAHSERGVAIVIAIFTLMLISVVATAMILMSGTDSAIKSNYKSAMHAFYDAKAGLEEGRGRLFWPNPNIPNGLNPPNPVWSCVFTAPGPMMPYNQACYIINPSGNEVVNPLDLTPGNPYADSEYQQEWGVPVTSASVQQPFITSNSAIASAGIAGPLYKWVRITPRTQTSAKLAGDVTDTNPLFYNGMQQLVSSGGNPVANAVQVLTITALAVTPYGSRRMVQYTVSASPLTTALPTFPSALTLDGNGVSFTGPNAGNGNGDGNGGGPGSFQISGKDSSAGPSGNSGVPAIGYTDSDDGPSIANAATPTSNYPSPGGTPSVALLNPWTPQTPNGLPTVLQTPSGLDSLVQSITQSADVVITPSSGTADQTSLPSGMSAANPMVVVVNGNFNLHGNGTGYGLLLVTGTLDYDPDASWNGVILVIGRGVFTSTRNGTGTITGAVFVAQTRDASGHLLADPSLMHSSFTQKSGSGIRYNSGLVAATQALLPYQVLSFREIPQTTP